MSKSIKIFLPALLTIIMVAAGLFCCHPDKGKPGKNVVFIVIDTLRADHLGCYGYFRDTSPNIDAFAGESVKFNRAYSHSPWTMPSVGTMFTSLHPRDHGIVEWRNSLEKKFYTIAEHFDDTGYKTIGITSHICFEKKYGFHQGFDKYHKEILKKGDSRNLASSDMVSDLAIKALGRYGEKPFFLFLHYFDPHNTYLQHKGFKFSKTLEGAYDSEIAFTDHHLGRVLDHLKSKNMLDNTIVAIVADHGEEFGDHGGRRHTRTLYDEVLRVPMLIKAPGFKPGQVDHVVPLIDIAPTLCSLAGISIPNQFHGAAFPFNENGFTLSEDREVIAEAKYKADKRGVVQGSLKFIHDRVSNTVELFDLLSDPKEQTNLAKDQEQVVDELNSKVELFYSKPGHEAGKSALDDQMKQKLESLGYL